MRLKGLFAVGVISFGVGALLAVLPGRAGAGACNCHGPSWGGSPPGCYSWGQGFDAAGGNPICCERTGGFTTDCPGFGPVGPKPPPIPPFPPEDEED